MVETIDRQKLLHFCLFITSTKVLMGAQSFRIHDEIKVSKNVIAKYMPTTSKSMGAEVSTAPILANPLLCTSLGCNLSHPGHNGDFLVLLYLLSADSISQSPLWVIVRFSAVRLIISFKYVNTEIFQRTKIGKVFAELSVWQMWLIGCVNLYELQQSWECTF